MSINKVAKLAGVSSSTVSRVINNHPRVAAQTAESVRQAMQELNYVPSDRRPGPKPRSAARAKSIAFLVLGASPQRTTPGFEDLLRGVSFAASTNGLNLAFAHVPDSEHVPPGILDHPLDGLLLHGAPPTAELLRQLRRTPTVWLMGNRRRPDWGDHVMPDSYEIGDLAAHYLLQRGHRCLGFLNLDASHWPFRMYAQSFSMAAAEHHVECRLIQQMPSVSDDDYWHRFNGDSVSRLVQQFLHLSPRPTGLLVADSMQAASMQPVLQSRGVELGEGKTEIIVSSNEQPYLAGLTPRPAVIDLRIESIGRRGVEQLLWRLQHKDVPERIITTIEPSILDGAETLQTLLQTA